MPSIFCAVPGQIARAGVCLLVAVVFSGAIFAAPGSLSGLVFTVGADGVQIAWPNARVTLRHIPSGRAYSTVTGATGEFSFPGVEAGDCDLTVTLEGFERKTVRLKIEERRESRVEVQLQPREQREQVTVTSEQPQLETKSPETRGLGEIRVARKSAILLNDQFQELLPLVPGVVRGPDGFINIKGARSTQSGAYVNSTTVIDPVNGLSTLSLPLEAVNEVHVVSNPFSAEYGRFSGGVVEVDTRPGGDDWRFGLKSFWPRARFRDGSIHGLRAFTPRATVSGPLVKGKAYVHQAVDYHFVRTRVPSLLPPEDETVLESFDAFTQLDVNLNLSNKLTGSFTFYPQNLSFVNLNTFYTVPATPNFRQRGYHIILNERAIFGGGGFLETNFSAKRFDAHTFPARFSAGGLVLFPEVNSGGWHQRQDRESWTLGWAQTYHFAPRHARGYHFMTGGYYFLRSFYDGTVSLLPVSVQRPDGSLSQRMTYGPAAVLNAGKNDFAIFFQDRWQIRPRVALELGVRLDREDLSRDVVNVGPRVAMVIAPTQDNKTAIRGGFGIFFDKVPLQLGTFLDYPRMTLSDFALDGVTLTAGPRTFAHRVVTDDGKLHAPHSYAWNVQVDRELAPSLLFRFSFEQRETRGDFYLEPVESGPLSEIQLRDDGEQTYREFQWLLRWRANERSTLFASYVHSRLRGELNVFEPYFGNYPYPILRPNQRGRQPYDVPHRFLFWGTIGLPWKLEALPVLDIASGFPYSRLDNVWNFVGARNGEGRFPTFVALDLQVTRTFSFTVRGKKRRVTLGGRIFNITNHFNPRDVQQHAGSPSFRTFFNSIERKFRAKIDFEF